MSKKWLNVKQQLRYYRRPNISILMIKGLNDWTWWSWTFCHTFVPAFLEFGMCLTKLSSLKCVDSVGNAVTCKLRPTGFKVNAVYRAQCIFIVEPLEVFQPFSPITVRCRLFDWWINIHHMIAITSTTICNFRCFTKEIYQCFSFSLFFSPLLFPRYLAPCHLTAESSDWVIDR